MTKHRDKSKAVVVADLEDGSLHPMDSLSAAASFMGVSITLVSRMLSQRSASGKYFVYKAGKDKENSQMVTALRSYYHTNGKVRGMKPADDTLVSLRIDRHTVILVTPDKATPEYAQQWREKHEKAGKREASWNSKTSFE